MIFDEEKLLFDLETLVKSKLSAKLLSISNEKNDGITLEAPNADAWFDSANDRVFNYNPFVYFGISDCKPFSVGNVSSREVTLFFEICFTDSGNFASTKKVLRYTRALREIIEENYKKFAQAGTLKIEQMVPVTVDNQSARYKIGGIYISCAIA
jgi:hypothetical protein